MVGRKRIKQAKKCGVCGKLIREENKSGLCRHHYMMDYNKKLRKVHKEKHICVQCRNKVEPIIIYPAGDKVSPTITYPARCYSCRKIQNEYYKNITKKSKKQQKTESVTTLK